MRVGDKIKYGKWPGTIVGYPKSKGKGDDWALVELPGYAGHRAKGVPIYDDNGMLVVLDEVKNKYFIPLRTIVITEPAIVGDGFDTTSKELINKKINRI
jgi:hypothetical protein